MLPDTFRTTTAHWKKTGPVPLGGAVHVNTSQVLSTRLLWVTALCKKEKMEGEGLKDHVHQQWANEPC